MDIKEFKKNIKTSCEFVAEKTKKKECNKIFMCNWNNCQKEIVENEEERKSCENEKDFNKQIDCRMKLFQKSDKFAALAHCEANKCPHIRVYIKKYGEKLGKILTKKFKVSKELKERKKCIESHCDKEIKQNEKQKQKVYEKIFECQKKFATMKEQEKCSKQDLKNYLKYDKQHFNCIHKYCKFKPSDTKNTSKKTNTKNKKTKKN